MKSLYILLEHCLDALLIKHCSVKWGFTLTKVVDKADIHCLPDVSNLTKKGMKQTGAYYQCVLRVMINTPQFIPLRRREGVVMKAIVIGGERKWAQKFILKMNTIRGLHLTMIAHQSSDKSRKWRRLPSNVEIVIVLKDVTSHKLRDWARAECKAHNHRFIEVSQQLSYAIRSLQKIAI